MDESTVRERAQAHGDAVVAGDLRRAAGDLAPEVGPKAQEVMGQLPRPVEAVEIAGVEAEGDEYVVRIRYGGGGSETTVISRWAERDGAPKITDLAVG